MGEAVFLGVVAGAIIGALFASEAPDWAKGLGLVVVLTVAAGGMGITHLDTYQGGGALADHVNIAIIAWAISQTRYALVFWFAGLISFAAAGAAVERIRKGQ